MGEDLNRCRQLIFDFYAEHDPTRLRQDLVDVNGMAVWTMEKGEDALNQLLNLQYSATIDFSRKLKAEEVTQNFSNVVASGGNALEAETKLREELRERLEMFLEEYDPGRATDEVVEDLIQAALIHGKERLHEDLVEKYGVGILEDDEIEFDDDKDFDDLKAKQELRIFYQKHDPPYLDQPEHLDKVLALMRKIGKKKVYDKLAEFYQESVQEVVVEHKKKTQNAMKTQNLPPTAPPRKNNPGPAEVPVQPPVVQSAAEKEVSAFDNIDELRANLTEFYEKHDAEEVENIDDVIELGMDIGWDSLNASLADVYGEDLHTFLKKKADAVEKPKKASKLRKHFNKQMQLSSSGPLNGSAKNLKEVERSQRNVKAETNPSQGDSLLSSNDKFPTKPPGLRTDKAQSNPSILQEEKKLEEIRKPEPRALPPVKNQPPVAPPRPTANDDAPPSQPRPLPKRKTPEKEKSSIREVPPTPAQNAAPESPPRRIPQPRPVPETPEVNAAPPPGFLSSNKQKNKARMQEVEVPQQPEPEPEPPRRASNAFGDDSEQVTREELTRYYAIHDPGKLDTLEPILKVAAALGRTALNKKLFGFYGASLEQYRENTSNQTRNSPEAIPKNNAPRNTNNAPQNVTAPKAFNSPRMNEVQVPRSPEMQEVRRVEVVQPVSYEDLTQLRNDLVIFYERFDKGKLKVLNQIISLAKRIGRKALVARLQELYGASLDDFTGRSPEVKLVVMPPVQPVSPAYYQQNPSPKMVKMTPVNTVPSQPQPIPEGTPYYPSRKYQAVKNQSWEQNENFDEAPPSPEESDDEPEEQEQEQEPKKRVPFGGVNVAGMGPGVPFQLPPLTTNTPSQSHPQILPMENVKIPAMVPINGPVKLKTTGIDLSRTLARHKKKGGVTEITRNNNPLYKLPVRRTKKPGGYSTASLKLLKTSLDRKPDANDKDLSHTVRQLSTKSKARVDVDDFLNSVPEGRVSNLADGPCDDYELDMSKDGLGVCRFCGFPRAAHTQF